MSDFNERLDEEAFQQMLVDEYAPAVTELGVPDFKRAKPAVAVRSESHTYEEWRELKIAEKNCPMPGCSGRLDEDFFCSGCGCVSLPKVLPATEKAA